MANKHIEELSENLRNRRYLSNTPIVETWHDPLYKTITLTGTNPYLFHAANQFLLDSEGSKMLYFAGSGEGMLQFINKPEGVSVNYKDPLRKSLMAKIRNQFDCDTYKSVSVNKVYDSCRIMTGVEVHGQSDAVLSFLARLLSEDDKTSPRKHLSKYHNENGHIRATLTFS